MLFKKKKDIVVDKGLKHIAFIMDGNGRWAKKRALPRQAGHKAGATAFEKTIDLCHKMGINYVTVYAFSTENWSRPKNEVDAIMNLLDSYIERAKEHPDVRYIFLGDKSVLESELREKMLKLEQDSQDNKLVLNIAFNYGGRAEIVNACNQLIKEGKTVVSEEDISKKLYTVASPDPDLIVRTANEYRISNFLLWQCAYSEFYFTKALWPDFNEAELIKAIESFNNRKRRYGGLNKNED